MAWACPKRNKSCISRSSTTDQFVIHVLSVPQMCGWAGRQAGGWVVVVVGVGVGVACVCGSVVDRFADTVLYLLQWRLWANSQFVMQYVAVVMNFILRFPWPFVIKAPKVSAIVPNAVARPSPCTLTILPQPCHNSRKSRRKSKRNGTARRRRRCGSVSTSWG